MFGIDSRSLAAFRIGIGWILICDAVSRAVNVSAHYSDQGVLPRWSQLAQGDREGVWSLHFFSGSAWAQGALLGAAVLFGFWLVIGYRTRLAAAASWILLYSVQFRNPLVLNGGDVLLRCLLFWSLFVPLGATASVDSRMRPPNEPLPKRIASMGAAALLLQLTMMYCFSAALKRHPRWMTEGSAIYYALHYELLGSEFGKWLLQSPDLLRPLTLVTYWMEWVMPVLVFSPVLNRWLRLLGFFCFTAFHLGLALTFSLGVFAWAAIAGWLLFLPGDVWDWLGRLSERRFGWLSHRLRNGSAAAWKAFGKPESPRLAASPANNALVAGLLLYTIAWNVRTLDYNYWEPRLLPPSWNAIGHATGLSQSWQMFAPYPATDDGWFVMRGVLHDGSQVDLWTMSPNLTTAKPPYVSRHYLGQRWRKYLTNLWQKRNRERRKPFADWLRRRWDAAHAEDDAGRRVRKVQLVFYLETTPPPGRPIGPGVPVSLGEWDD